MCYRKIILSHYEKALSRRGSLSLRSYGKYIGVGGSSLSSVLAGKRGIPFSTALEICKKLNFSESEKDEFLKSINEEKKFNQSLKKRIETTHSFKTISKIYEEAIVHPMSMAIVCYLDSNNEDKTLEGILKNIEIEREDAEKLLSQLVIAKLIDKKNDSYFVLESKIKTTTNIPSESIRKRHKNTLKLAASKLDSVPLEKRYFTAMTVTCSEKKIEAAKDEIQRFLKRISKILQHDTKNEQVYEVAVQLFPQTKTESL